MLVVVVGVLSLAVNAQGPFQGRRCGRPPRPARTTPRLDVTPATQDPQRGRYATGANAGTANRLRPRLNRPANRRRPLSRTSLSLTCGPLIPRPRRWSCRLSTSAHWARSPAAALPCGSSPTEGDPFEVTTRVAFPTPEERARVKVGGTIPVRYDSYDHRRVVVDPDQEAGELRLLVRRPVRRPGRRWQGARRAGGQL